MRVFVVDGRWEVREGLRLLLEQETDATVVGEAADLRGLLYEAQKAQPDVVLVDWELEGVPGHGTVMQLHALCPRARVIASSVRPESRETALSCGADGFLLKGDPVETILDVIFYSKTE
ncbi:MAG TPA: hypothetical protein DCL63_07510 [Firmicutes bacterium]|jgi:DNA-binding NarL/FixJ family response regulator|nr:hypothetical protein [Bacillota bacterium]HBK60854.1 hypothetical protein [Bacillota bacterium]